MSSRDERDFALARRIVMVLLAIGCCWPLVGCGDEFRLLFLFEDEWDQLKELDEAGVWSWAVSAFGENFMPVSKLMWFGALSGAGGWYFGVIIAMWLNHALNVFLLGRLLVRGGVGLAGAALAMVLLGYSATTFETLTWSIQWTNVVTITFFLLALLQLSKIADAAPKLTDYGLLGVFVTGSALSFVRGIFCGPAIAGMLLLPVDRRLAWSRRIALGIWVLAPAVIVFGLMRLKGVGGAEVDGAIVKQMAVFALHSYARSPIANWWSIPVPSDAGLIVLTLVKSAILAGGWWLASARMRPLLTVLLLFEIANDLALGLGRYHTGLGAAASSRYQYNSLLVFGPFLGVIFDRVVTLPQRFPRWRALASAAVLLLVIWTITKPWPRIMSWWTPQRGAELREAMALPPEAAPEHFVRLPWISNEEAMKLVQKYHLH